MKRWPLKRLHQPLASSDPTVEEILRVWSSPTHPYQLTLRTHWDDPGAWGILLVDVAKHAAQAYSRNGVDRGAALRRIVELFEAELSRPTDGRSARSKELRWDRGVRRYRDSRDPRHIGPRRVDCSPMTPELSAADLLQRTASIYANCSSYQATGAVTTVFVTGKWPWDRRTTKKRFKTAFVRPDRFYFEYREVGVGPESEWRGGVIWAKNSEQKNWSTQRFISAGCESISDAVGTFAGVSDGASPFIPRMLISDSGGASSLPEPFVLAIPGIALVLTWHRPGVLASACYIGAGIVSMWIVERITVSLSIRLAPFSVAIVNPSQFSVREDLVVPVTIFVVALITVQAVLMSK
jgi:hypothetical protein